MKLRSIPSQNYGQFRFRLTAMTSILVIASRCTSALMFPSSRVTRMQFTNQLGMQRMMHMTKNNIQVNRFSCLRDFATVTKMLSAHLIPIRYTAPGRRHLSIFMSAGDEDEANDASKSTDSIWNVAGLKKEVQRLILRCHKKIGKANERYEKARATVQALTDPSSSASLEELENCPNVQLLEEELTELQSRLKGLNLLAEQLHTMKNKETILPLDVATLAISLGVDDQPPTPPPRGAPKPKGPRLEVPRKPYRCYYAADGTEIRVGKRATDNDELTLNREHRNNADWWMHASGCPGSHVVIRNTSEQLPADVIQDAAALAARQSKCGGSVVKVNLTRCRDISKPPGAKAGLVMLNGNVRTVSVNMKEAAKRLTRLDETLVVN
ncbi:hypothetical protein MPSEU_000824500 [Mayamaea pseudoterrestris]|nr:hypothetical protein MPSEU_000824500 [Mayamaea pseudoterrestris]